MPSTTENSGEVIDDSDCEAGGDKKRIKLEPQRQQRPVDEDEDSGMEEYEEEDDDADIGDADGGGDEGSSLALFKDSRSLSERSFGPPFQYVILDAGAAYLKMLACINECQRILTHSPTTVRILLNHRKWDIDKLYDDYYESDTSTMFKAAGLPDPAITLPEIQDVTTPIDCAICSLRVDPTDIYTAKCGHSFCNNCWQSYLLTKVTGSMGHARIECPAASCNFVIEDDIVLEKIKTDNLRAQELYKKQIIDSYVLSNRRMNWCPGKNCPGHVIELEQGSVRWCPVTCSCNYSFCFNCREEWHGPITCNWLKKWKKKCSDDSETVNWISVNTKRCPKCEVPIEKNGGCNHMSCTNSACRHHFCWICLGDWNLHQGANYNCNRFQENNDNINSEQSIRQNSLKRYLFYFDRYFNHHKSLKSEHELIDKMETKIKAINSNGVSSKHDLQFLKKGVQILCQCRQTLMYTYVFAYYLARNNNANIFEDNQSDLQRATEELSGLLERESVEDNFPEMKRTVMDKTNYCESRCEVLLKHVYEGYEENNYWTYIESETPNA